MTFKEYINESKPLICPQCEGGIMDKKWEDDKFIKQCRNCNHIIELPKPKISPEAQSKRDKMEKLMNKILNNENISIPIKVGDVLLGGKFKNRRIVVKEIGKNEKGEITINGKPLMRFRLTGETED